MCTRKYFSSFKQLSAHQYINTIKTAEWRDGEDPRFTGTTSTPSQVPNALLDYYKMLFDRKKISREKADLLLRKLENKKITSTTSKKLEAPISDAEVLGAMQHLHLGSQAGPDRIPNAFYRCCAKYLAPKLGAVLREALRREQLPSSFLEGDIALMYKKKERDDPRNYRPLTMLNVDYKIYTRILANRMKKVVHQFVSESQKGFVPDSFIAECSMLLNLIEAWVNDDPENREGIFLFLDMEKAFDRVSFEFLNDAMDSLGFGPNFKTYVGLMYNTEAPPKRRIYANGYYSEWFTINSGVAQGCPLSPILFLVVAETLKISLDLNKKLKGIHIGGSYYKLSQFADDTTLLLASIEEIQEAEKQIQLWCEATGMRENISKREGLAMGNLRNSPDLPPEIHWIPDGDWAISLGVPHGNDLDSARWWSKKIDAVRVKSDRWRHLNASSYFGRNLVVQALYFGSLRYWLFSLPMPGQTRATVQADADILWFSKEPILGKDAKRFRRFCARRTAIGPQSLGGLGTMDWACHVTGVLASWIFRYMDPSESSWKTLLDFLLLQDRHRVEKFSEGRQTFLHPISNSEKMRLLTTKHGNLPKKATYIRDCIRAFFKIGIKQDISLLVNIAAESLWHNPRFQIPITHLDRRYLMTTVETTILGDIMDKATNRPFTRQKWKEWIIHLDHKHHGGTLDDRVADRAAGIIYDYVAQIPAHIIQALQQPYAMGTNLLKPQVVYTITYTPRSPAPAGRRPRRRRNPQRKAEVTEYFRYTPEHPLHEAILVKLDKRGVAFDTDRRIDATQPGATITEASTWNRPGRLPSIRGPISTVTTHTQGWVLGKRKDMSLDTIRIADLTHALTMKRFVPPTNTENAWQSREPGLDRLHHSLKIPWPQIWAMKSLYTTPRDKIQWLKAKHRTLYTTGHDPAPDNICVHCRSKDTILHMATCHKTRMHYWGPLLKLMTDIGVSPPTGHAELSAFIMLGRTEDEKAANPTQADILALGWRCLYACNVHSRVDKVPPDLDRALLRCYDMLLSRIKAHGRRWRKWVEKNANSGRLCMIPNRFRVRPLLRQDADGTYEIRQELYDCRSALAKKIKDARANTAG